MINKDDMNELPDEVKKLIQFAEQNGSDVSVIKINNNKNKDKKINKILSKLNKGEDNDDNSSELLNKLDDIQDKVAEEIPHNDVKKFLMNKISKLDLDTFSDEELFRIVNNSYMDLLKACGRKPVLNILLTVSKKGNADLRTVGINNQKELGKVFSEIGKMIEDGDVPIDSQNMGEL